MNIITTQTPTRLAGRLTFEKRQSLDLSLPRLRNTIPIDVVIWSGSLHLEVLWDLAGLADFH